MSNDNPYKRVPWSRGGSLPCTTEACSGILHYNNVGDLSRTKGTITLFCPECTVKHWGEAADLELRAKMLKQQARQAARDASE